MNVVDLGSIFLNVITPVITIAALGSLLARIFHLEGRALSKISLYLFSPALTFTAIYRSTLGGEFVSILAFAFIMCALMAIVVLPLVRALRFDRQTASAFLLSTLFVNAGNFGLPLSLFAFGEEGLSRAVVFFVGASVLAQTVAVFIAARGNVANRAAFFQVFKMPLVYAVGLALVFNAARWEVYPPLMKAVDLISDGAIPLILIILGLELAKVNLVEDRLGIGLASIVKLVVTPIVAIGLAHAMGMEGLTRAICIFQASMPTAVIVSIIAVEFDARPRFVTSSVFVSTLASLVTLTVLLGSGGLGGG